MTSPFAQGIQNFAKNFQSQHLSAVQKFVNTYRTELLVLTAGSITYSYGRKINILSHTLAETQEHLATAQEYLLLLQQDYNKLNQHYMDLETKHIKFQQDYLQSKEEDLKIINTLHDDFETYKHQRSALRVPEYLQLAPPGEGDVDPFENRDPNNQTNPLLALHPNITLYDIYEINEHRDLIGHYIDSVESSVYNLKALKEELQRKEIISFELLEDEISVFFDALNKSYSARKLTDDDIALINRPFQSFMQRSQIHLQDYEAHLKEFMDFPRKRATRPLPQVHKFFRIYEIIVESELNEYRILEGKLGVDFRNAMDLFVSFRTNSTTAEDFYEVIYKQLLELKQSFAEQFEIQNASVSKLQKQVEAKLQKKERLLQTVPIFDTFNAVNAKVYEYYNGIGDLSQVVEVQPSTTVIMATTTSEQSQKDAV